VVAATVTLAAQASEVAPGVRDPLTESEAGSSGRAEPEDGLQPILAACAVRECAAQYYNAHYNERLLLPSPTSHHQNICLGRSRCPRTRPRPRWWSQRHQKECAWRARWGGAQTAGYVCCRRGPSLLVLALQLMTLRRTRSPDHPCDHTKKKFPESPNLLGVPLVLSVLCSPPCHSSFLFLKSTCEYNGKRLSGRGSSLRLCCLLPSPSQTTSLVLQPPQGIFIIYDAQN
jgi:hypothetical protein